MATKTFTLCATEREQALNDLFTTACEGGVNYWARFETYRWSNGDRVNPQQVNEFEARLTAEDDDEEGKVYVVDAAVLRKGVRLAYKDYRGPNVSAYQKRALADLQWGRWDELDYDADTADLVVQYGLFGKLVYG